MASHGPRAVPVLALSLALAARTASADEPPKPAPPPQAPPAGGDAPAPPPPKPNVPSIGEISVVVAGKLDDKKKPAAAPARAWKPKKEVVRTGAVANAPSFQLLKDGSSRVTLTVNAKVPVIEELAGAAEKKEEKAAPAKPDPKKPAKAAPKAKAKEPAKADAVRVFRATYRLKGATAPGKTNRLPLPTDFFETPIERVSLVDDGADALLVIDLRERVTPVMRQIDGERGLTLQVDLPRPARGDKAEKKN